MTGRRLCGDCDDELTGLAAGMIAHPEAPVPHAIATAGWYQRLRARRRR